MLQFDPALRYQCVQCGRSCASWNVWVEDQVLEQIRPLEMTLRVIQERGQAFEEEGGRYKMFRDSSHDACGYRSPALLCNIHSELGMTAKPLGCQQFPYLLRRLPDGRVLVSASFACTAVREQQGPLLSESRAEVESLLGRQAFCEDLPAQLDGLPGQSLQAWQVFEWEGEFERLRSSLGWRASLSSALACLCQQLPLQGQPLSGNWEWFRTVLVTSLLKLCLDDPDRKLWPGIDQAVAQGGCFELPEFAWSGAWSELEQFQLEQVAGRFAEEEAAFLGALWFRRAHWSLGGLLPGLLMYWALPDLLEKLTFLFACRDAQAVTHSQYGEALRLVELSLLAHSKNGALVVERLAPHCLQL
jgi:hypothetical protein